MDIAKNRQDFWKHVPENFYKTNSSQAVYRREFIANLIYANKINSVLELGCNSGANLLYILKKNPTITVCGIDICAEAIEYGKRVEKNTANMMVGSIYDLSRFENNSFDLVFTCTVLQHIPSENVESVIKEMIRISKNFVINIEDHKLDNRVFWQRNGIDHRWETNYEKIYKNLDHVPNILDVVNLMGKTSGGANNLIWISKIQNELILPELRK